MKLLSPRQPATTPHQYTECEPATRDTRPGRASKYIGHLKQIVRKAAELDCDVFVSVVLDVRVSSDKQRRYGNTDHQLEECYREKIKLENKYGVPIKVVKHFDEGDVPGWMLWKSGRPTFVKAAKFALKHDALLVGLDTSRLVRNRHYSRSGKLPTVADFEDLTGLAGGAQLVTIVHPDTPEDRSGATFRGQKAKNAQPGRPKTTRPGDTKRRRMQFKLPVIRLCKQGLNNYEIARQLELPEKTVRDWRKRYRKYWDASFLANKR